MKSPLRYPGGKSRAAKQIIEYFPKNLTELCSPFFGGGSIELACAEKGIRVYGYDAFEPLINFWWFTIWNAKKLAHLVEIYYPMSKEQFYEFQKCYYSIESKMGQAAIFYVLNRASYSGLTLSGGMSLEHQRFTKNTISYLRNFKVLNITVKHNTFQESIPLHYDDFLYLDPPYSIDSNMYGIGGDLHKSFDHQRLSELLNNRGNWVLSYNDCEFVRDIYGKHEFYDISWKYGMGKDKTSNEVVIVNRG